MLVVVKVEDNTHAAELGSTMTLCGLALDRSAPADPLLDMVTHEECLRRLARARIWGHQEWHPREADEARSSVDDSPTKLPPVVPG